MLIWTARMAKAMPRFEKHWKCYRHRQRARIWRADNVAALYVSPHQQCPNNRNIACWHCFVSGQLIDCRQLMMLRYKERIMTNYWSALTSIANICCVKVATSARVRNDVLSECYRRYSIRRFEGRGETDVFSCMMLLINALVEMSWWAEAEVIGFAWMNKNDIRGSDLIVEFD